MNDGSKSTGMAAVLTIKGAEASWKLFRAKPLTAAEKTQAKNPDPAAASRRTAPPAAPAGSSLSFRGPPVGAPFLFPAVG